jgi:hypothetical protein
MKGKDQLSGESGFFDFDYPDNEFISKAVVMGGGNVCMRLVADSTLGYGVSFAESNIVDGVRVDGEPAMEVLSKTVEPLDAIIDSFKVAKRHLLLDLGNADPHVGINGEIRGEERIVSAANRLSCGLIVTGARHCDKLMNAQARAAGLNLTRSEQGFVNQRGEYLSRTEAWQVAKTANQIIFRCGGDTSDGGALYSENLY